MDQTRQSDPQYYKTSEDIENLYRQSFSLNQARGPIMYSLPVVVFVIEDPTANFIGPTNDEIISGIDLLNRTLDGQDPCDENNSGVTTGIQFCLASRDRYGMETTGIVRTSHILSTVDLCTQEMALKNLVRMQEDLFPQKDYINLYIVSSITASCVSNGDAVAGFAAYPAAHGTALDGIVIESSVFTSGNCDLFKVLVHETGHYFNLLHTFEGGCKNDDCLSDGDRVCDTPPDNNQDFYPSNPCKSMGIMNSCSSDVNLTDPNNQFSIDQNDLTDNFMDYAPTECAKYFTSGQVTRMHTAIEGPRQSLLISSGCLPPCVDPPSYVLDISDDTLLIGEELVIIPVGSGIHNDSYWKLGNEIFLGSELHWIADTTGTLSFIFYPFHSDPTCIRLDTIVIRVDCYLQPQLSISDLTPDVGDTLFFTSPGSIEENLIWYIDGELAGQGDSLVWPILTEGSYQVKIEFCDGTCCGNAVEYIQAGECPSGLEGSLWMFARDGITLDFSSGAPEETMPVAQSTFADEASSIVCDKNGNLLFYTNGRYIWDRNHTNLTPPGPMISERLRGNHSSTNIMSLPVPDKPYLYYIIYNTSMQGDALGFGDDTTTLYYATIDMRLNGGLGEVVQRNILLKRGMTEKIAATRHCNGRDWWLLSYQASTESFLAWLIDAEGIHPPVSSKVGVGLYDNYNARAGEINFSPDGTMVATAISYSVTGSFGAIEIFRFDPSEGIVFDPIVVREENIWLYGIEFSPNGRFLYAQIDYKSVSQYCLDNYHQDSIRNSEIIIFSGQNGQNHEALQTGRDGKIYIARYGEENLSIINKPNLKGAASDFKFEGLPLTYGESFVGLPSLPNGIYNPEKPHIRGPYEVCDTLSNVKYYVSGNCKPQEQEWKVLGTSSLVEQKGDSVWITPVAPGYDTLVVVRYTPCRTVSDTLIYEVKSCQTELICSPDFQWIDADTLLCPGEGLRIQYSTNATVVRFSNETGQLIGTGNSSTYYQNPPPPEGDYLIYLWNSEGCDTTISFHIQNSPSIGFNWLHYDSVVCTGQIVNIEFSSFAQRTDLLDQDGSWIEVNPSQPLQFGPLFQDTSFQIRLRHEGWDCDTIAVCSIRVEQANTTTIDSIYICSGDSLWLWSAWIFTPGEYDSLFQSTYGCDSTSIVSVFMNPLPVIEKVETYDEACGNLGSIEVIATDTNGNLEYAFNSNPYSFDATIDSLASGEYFIAVRNSSGCVAKDTVEILLHNLPIISNANVVPAECGMNNGSIHIHAHAENSPLEYSIGGGIFIADSNFTSLPAGIYEILVKDTFGCIVDQLINIPNLDGPEIDSLQIVPEYCGLQNGEITIIASSGSGTLNYSMDGVAFSDSNIFSGLQSGIYQIIVQDGSGCEVQAYIEIPEVDATLIESVITTSAGCEMANGIIEVITSSGNVTGFSLDQVNFQKSPLFESLPPGDYTVYLQSHDGCIDSAIATISMRPGPSITEIQITDPLCSSDKGEIHILAEGEPSLSISIDGGNSWDESSFIDNLSPGEYLIIIRDSFGCIDSQNIHISTGEGPALSMVEMLPSICNGGGQIKVEASGDGLEFRLNGDVMSSDGLFPNLKAGDYLLSVYDKNGCFLDTLLTIIETGCGVYVANVFSPNGDGVNDHFGPQFPSENYKQVLFEIYDRWGTAVFGCQQATLCEWDGFFRGKQSPSGVYAWRLKYTNTDERTIELTGNVTLIR